jgi:3-deoxy-D-manno-octulosonic-acid transferase
MLPVLYRAATKVARPLVVAYLGRRRRQGKEDSARFGERLGRASLARPAGPLVWVHAASVGESLSVLILIERILSERPGLSVLMTTGTVGAARLIEPRLPRRALHQYVPVDLPDAVERFLGHWRPDLGIWVESELWPNLVLATARRQIPMLLLNARLSPGSHARWRALPGLVRPILSCFALCLAQDETQAAWLRELGAVDAGCLGDLKTAGDPLAADPDALAELRRQIGDRPRWLVASTHPGEEEVVAETHRAIGSAHPGLLTILAPRHPGRGEEIAAMLRSRGLRIARRSRSETIAAETDVYLVDTLGEMGLFYRLAGIVLIGGSLGSGAGGHNPFEAARLDCAILHGPDMRNSAVMASAMQAAGAAEIVGTADQLAAAVMRLIADPGQRDARASAAARAAEAGRGVLIAVLDRIGPWLDPLAPVSSGAARRPEREPVVAGLDARA